MPRRKTKRNAAELLLMGANPSHRKGRRGAQTDRRNPSGIVVTLHDRGGYYDYFVTQDGRRVYEEVGNRALRTEGQAKAHARQKMVRLHARGLLRNPWPGLAFTNASKRNRNSKGDAAEMYEKFQGKAATGATEISEPPEPDAELAELGLLKGLNSKIRGHGDLKLKFTHKDGVKVACDPEGTQLYLIGGDQTIDCAGLPVDCSKRFVDLGEAHGIIYRASKAQADFEASDYIHKFGEEGGKRPRLTYDQERQRLELAGGDYHVDAPGIIN